MKNLKRTFKFVKGNGRFVVISVIMIILVQLLNFISPLIVKEVLDNYILGIEYDWVEVSTTDDKTVTYNNRQFKQVRYIDDNDLVIKDMSLIVYKDGYYLCEEKIETGIKEVKDNVLTIELSNKEVLAYDVVRLSKEEVVSFYQPVLTIIIVLVLVLFLRSILSIIFSFIGQRANNVIISDIAQRGRTKAMESVERLPIAYFDEEPAGKMAARIQSDVDGMISLYRLSVNVLLNAVLSFVFAYIGMFYLDPILALISFIIYPLAFIWIKIYLKYLRKIAIKVNELRSLLTAKINEIINGINILQIFNFKKHTVKEFNEINQNFMDEQMKEVKLHMIGGWNMLSILRGIITVLVVVYFGYQRLTIGDIVITAGLIYAYNEYLLKIVEPLNIILNQVGEIEHANVRTERIHKLIEGVQEDDYKTNVDKYVGNIDFEDVWFSYVENEYVLKGISFHIDAGTTVGLVGHTGSGKTSLMNLLLRFYDLKENEGSIKIDGVDIKTNSKRTYREHIGIVLQEPVLFKGTIASNIRFGKENVSDQEIIDTLTIIGGKKIIDKFENGINQDINRAGSNMSCGEKQIIALARVLIHNPSILIMDEATSHIDTETEIMIKKALEVVSQNRTMIIIAHRLSTVVNADKIIVLDHGLKIEEGNHQQLLHNNNVYANIYRAQAGNSLD